MPAEVEPLQPDVLLLHLPTPLLSQTSSSSPSTCTAWAGGRRSLSDQNKLVLPGPDPRSSSGSLAIPAAVDEASHRAPLPIAVAASSSDHAAGAMTASALQIAAPAAAPAGVGHPFQGGGGGEVAVVGTGAGSLSYQNTTCTACHPHYNGGSSRPMQPRIQPQMQPVAKKLYQDNVSC